MNDKEKLCIACKIAPTTIEIKGQVQSMYGPYFKLGIYRKSQSKLLSYINNGGMFYIQLDRLLQGIENGSIEVP